MKNIMILLFAIMFAWPSAAQENPYRITEQEARTAAIHFLAERTGSKNHDFTIHEVVKIAAGHQTLMYAVNFTRGFVLVSATKNTWPVTAYASEGTFSMPDREENVQAWLGQYERQIAFATETRTTPSPEIEEAWNRYLSGNIEIRELRSVEPLLISNWDQGKYYNELCPADPAGPGGHCYAGCVATAMGQVMYYFRHPQTGTGSYSYYHPDYDTISADFGNTTYHWNEMVNQLSGSNPATAGLLFHLGVSVDMVYGPSGSGMYNHKAAYSLRTYFKYSPETQYVYRDSTSMDWDSLLVSHLDRHIPMYYAGWSVPNINGHAFVVDGYQGDHYYHFNWGWGGSYDGYFYTDELTPGGSNFNLAQELIINCFPDTLNHSYPEYCQDFTQLTRLEGTFTDGSGPCYSYQPLTDCEWLIDPQNLMDSVSSITLSFQRFDLENENDYICVYDGPSDNYPLIGMLTGNQLPVPLTSSANQLYIVFHSYDQNTAPGFYASYACEQPLWCSGLTTITEPTAEISDGSGSFYYYNGNICMWYIKPDNAAEITMHFDAFDTEADKDFVKIYDPTTSTLLAEYSGYYDPDDLPPPVTSASGEMYITFTTNSYVRADGWSGWYTSSSVGTGEKAALPDVILMPNPAGETVMISWHNPEIHPADIKVLDHTGRILLNKEIHHPAAGKQILNIRELKSGIYFACIETDRGLIVRKLIVK